TDPMLRRRCLKRIASKTAFRPVIRFLYTYVMRGGFLDGLAGWRYCLLRAAHDIHVEVKLAELFSEQTTQDERMADGRKETTKHMACDKGVSSREVDSRG